VLIISHDRDLLNTTTNAIVHLEEPQADLLSRRLTTSSSGSGARS
jgi:ATPase subunit of ABC transporter with duplicated ATPase domains